MTVITYKCPGLLYLAIPRKGLGLDEAIEQLVKAAHEHGATPHKEVLDAGILGDREPTLYAMKADLVPRCRCGSTTNVSANGCCGECQLKEAKAA